MGYGERSKLASSSTSGGFPAKSAPYRGLGVTHLDSACGPVSPTGKPRAIDGSDAIADWPLLNALVNAVGGATWVSLHHGGVLAPVQHPRWAGIVADGSEAAARRLQRVLTADPGMGVVRHADAGYPGGD
ncbi:MAG: hypothetical protein U0401_32900 [Anaerolineae bacterium]